ncbi:MAG: hypothetical protein LBK73_12635 [Treponema sp.]|nr:hypothetical protein [Treponema sp.]
MDDIGHVAGRMADAPEIKEPEKPNPEQPDNPNPEPNPEPNPDPEPDPVLYDCAEMESAFRGDDVTGAQMGAASTNIHGGWNELGVGGAALTNSKVELVRVVSGANGLEPPSAQGVEAKWIVKLGRMTRRRLRRR